MAEVQLQDVSKRFGRILAADRVSLDVGDREFLVLLGPSGCGKSTTLRLIAGLESASSGRISIGDRIVNDVPPKDRDVAMVFQNYALYPHMSVYDNMAFGLRMRRVPKAEIRDRVAAAADTLGIRELLERKPSQLSGGQRQRVAVGRAIVRNPAVFLFDEPLSNLDARLRVTMRSELVRLQRQLRTTTIYVTHDQVEAMLMGDRVVVMHQGRVQQVGTPRDVYDRPASRFVAEFIGSPPMNLLPAVVRGGTDRIQLDIAGVRWLLPGQVCGGLWERRDEAVTCGIRPENLLPAADDNAAARLQLPPAVVVASHQLGPETILEVQTAPPSQLLTVRWAGRVTAAPGEPLSLGVLPADLHFFAAGEGQRI